MVRCLRCNNPELDERIEVYGDDKIIIITCSVCGYRKIRYV